MSSKEALANSTAAASEHDRHKNEDVGKYSETGTVGRYTGIGDGTLSSKEDTKDHFEQGLGTSKQLPDPAHDIKIAHEGAHDEDLQTSPEDDIELHEKVQGQLLISPALSAANIQDAAKCLTAGMDPLTPPPLDDLKSESLLVATGSSVSTARAPSHQRSPLLSPTEAEEHDKIPVPSSRTSTDGEFDTKESETTEEQAHGSSASEIQSIMDQFDENEEHEGEIMLPRLEFADGLLENPTQHPPRKSSLESLDNPGPTAEKISTERGAFSPPSHDSSSQKLENSSPGSSIKSYSVRNSSLPQSVHYSTNDVLGPQSPASLHKPLPPEPDPEPDLPFDFHRFLEQLRHRTADPVAKFLRSFLIEFGKKQWMVHEQVKIISDFLNFIANKMAQCDIWRGVSDAEFENAKEGMEKLVMNRLYSQTFSPVIPPPVPIPGGKGKRKNIEKLVGPGRRGQHQEDIERDEILEQKVRIYGWVQEEHLDIAPVGDSGKTFLVHAQKELLKIKTYRAPRDKVICVLNCCKVIFGLLRNSKSADTSADSFVPLLIYVVLQANPEHLVSNVQYILRFRNQDKLGGEAGYYLSSLMGAIQFIENLDQTTLTVSDEEFERNVEAAVSAIAERHKEDVAQNSRHPQVSEKSALSEPKLVPQSSVEVEYATSRRSTSSRNATENTADINGTDEDSAVGGLLRNIQRPLSSFGRIFSDDPQDSHTPGATSQLLPASQPSPTRLSPAMFQPPRSSNEIRRSQDRPREADGGGRQSARLSADDAARQASIEAAEAQRLQRAEHNNVVETLIGMFPDLDKDIIDDVVREKQGRVGLAVDACLALGS